MNTFQDQFSRLPDTLQAKGSVIRELREEANLSQTLLAEKVGTSQRAISDAETERGETSTIFFVDIADYFNKKLSDIAHLPVDPAPKSQDELESERRVFQARMRILNGIHYAGSIPTVLNGKHVDLRRYVEDKWDDEKYNELRLSKNEKRMLWQSLFDTLECQLQANGEVYYVGPPLNETAVVGDLAFTYLIRMVEIVHGKSTEDHSRALLARISEQIQSAKADIKNGQQYYFHLTRILDYLHDGHGYLAGTSLSFLNAWTRLQDRSVAVNMDSECNNEWVLSSRNNMLELLALVGEYMLWLHQMDAEAASKLFAEKAEVFFAENSFKAEDFAEEQAQYVADALSFFPDVIQKKSLPEPNTQDSESKSRARLVITTDEGIEFHFDIQD